MYHIIIIITAVTDKVMVEEKNSARAAPSSTLPSQ